MNTPGRILVTGGAGFIGSQVVKQLLERGEDVVILDNLSVGSPDRVPEGAHLREGDIRDALALKDALAGCHTVCHLAARVSVRASVEQMLGDADVNLMGTLQVLSGCLNQGVQRLVIASSMAVYADAPDATPIQESYELAPASPYGISKLAAENYCRLMGQLKGLEVVVLRYFNTFGPGQTYTPYVGVITIFIRRLLEGLPPVIFGDGRQTRDFVHVEDVARATAQAVYMPAAGGTFNIGTGVGTTVNEIAAALCRRLGPGIQPEYAPAQPGELRFSVADITSARRFLDYQPRFSLEDHLDDVISYHRLRVPSG